jgi:hypothetical protein
VKIRLLNSFNDEEDLDWISDAHGGPSIAR